MRLVLSLSLLCIGAAASLSAQVPQMNTVQPESGKIGSVLQIHGVFLGKTKVDEVYLTDHTFDMKVKVLGQTDDYHRIPHSAFSKARPAAVAGEDHGPRAATA